MASTIGQKDGRKTEGTVDTHNYQVERNHDEALHPVCLQVSRDVVDEERRAEGRLGPAQRTCTTLDEKAGREVRTGN